jgi:hypothetical protein
MSRQITLKSLVLAQVAHIEERRKAFESLELELANQVSCVQHNPHPEDAHASLASPVVNHPVALDS